MALGGRSEAHRLIVPFVASVTLEEAARWETDRMSASRFLFGESNPGRRARWRARSWRRTRGDVTGLPR